MFGGLVAAGESYREAFARETQEELNIDVAQASYSFLFSLSPHKDDVSSFMHVYAIKTNSAPDYNKNDFESYAWMSVDQLKTAIPNGVPVKNDLGTVLAFFERASV